MTRDEYAEMIRKRPKLAQNQPLNALSPKNGIKSQAIDQKCVPCGSTAARNTKNAQSRAFNARFLTLWRLLGGPELQTEFRFHPVRRWRFDYYHEPSKILLDLDGGTFVRGGHSRGAQMIKDHEKRNTATSMGYKVFVLSTGMLTSEFIKPIIEYAKRAMSKP